MAACSPYAAAITRELRDRAHGRRKLDAWIDPKNAFAGQLRIRFLNEGECRHATHGPPPKQSLEEEWVRRSPFAQAAAEARQIQALAGRITLSSFR